jgi:hypothetical protein
MKSLLKTVVLLLSALVLVAALYLPVTNFSPNTNLDPQLPHSITVCGDEFDILTIFSLYLDPDPPKKGQSLHIDFKGYLSESIEQGAYIDLIVKYGVVKLLQKKIDLCEQAKEIDKECPLDEGEFSFIKDVDLPNDIPPGKYVVNARIKTVDDRQITCLNGVAIFRP